MNASIRKNWILAGCLIVMAVFAAFLTTKTVVSLCKTLRLSQTHHELKWIGIALHQYHDKYDSFPPAIVYDEDGSASHSWRSLIQPLLSVRVQNSQSFNAYDFTEPWDSQSNSALSLRFSKYGYQFLAPVGPHAAWSSKVTRKLRDFNDRTSDTALVIAIRNTGIKWNEPRDITVKDGFLTIGNSRFDNSQEMFILTADGTVEYYPAGISESLLKPMITLDANDLVPDR